MLACWARYVAGRVGEPENSRLPLSPLGCSVAFHEGLFEVSSRLVAAPAAEISTAINARARRTAAPPPRSGRQWQWPRADGTRGLAGK